MVAVTITVVLYLPFLIEPGISVGDLRPIILFTSLAAAAIGLMIARTALLPLKKLAAGSMQVTRGNFRSEVCRGVINKSRLKKADEVSRALLTFELMRRRILQLEENLADSVKSKRLDVEEINDQLIHKETILQQANAKLVGQHEELKRINAELASKNLELSQSNEKLQKLDKMKSDFILIAAHELRTPIQPILGSIHLAGKGLISNEEAWKSIELESKQLSNVANYILDVGKIESGTFTYEMKPIELGVLIDGITSRSSKLASEDGIISIAKEVDRDDVVITGDKERLLQAFGNIVSNAVKFAKNGNVTIRTKSDVEQKLIEIEIIDDGPGIPEEIMPVLFSKFVTKTQENERGTGLGLFITKSIIESHNGSIRADNNSAYGSKGATFTISLPMHQRSAPALTKIS
jgi:signal transduction histidine kinase